jgi:hypothetical protein
MKTVKIIEKKIEIETKDGVRTVKDFHRKADGTPYKPGDEIKVTDGHAKWLADHQFIAPLAKEKKENKEAAKRETK